MGREGGVSYLVVKPPRHVNPRGPWEWGSGLLGSRSGNVVSRGIKRKSPCLPTAWLFSPEASGFLV